MNTRLESSRVLDTGKASTPRQLRRPLVQRYAFLVPSHLLFLAAEVQTVIVQTTLAHRNNLSVVNRFNKIGQIEALSVASLCLTPNVLVFTVGSTV